MRRRSAPCFEMEDGLSRKPLAPRHTRDSVTLSACPISFMAQFLEIIEGEHRVLFLWQFVDGRFQHMSRPLADQHRKWIWLIGVSQHADDFMTVCVLHAEIVEVITIAPRERVKNSSSSSADILSSSPTSWSVGGRPKRCNNSE